MTLWAARGLPWLAPSVTRDDRFVRYAGDSGREKAQRRRIAGVLSVAVLLLARAAVAVPCAGDCNGDAEVRIHEVIACVNSGLGLADLAFCVACDENG